MVQFVEGVISRLTPATLSSLQLSRLRESVVNLQPEEIAAKIVG
jgi:hypothetical protein